MLSFFEHLEFLYRKWQLKRRNQIVVIRGSCRMCGQCCRGISLYIDNRWIKKEKHFKKAIKKYGYLERFEITGKTECNYLKFECRCLSADGTCTDYENRPVLCRKFPAPSIYLQSGFLPEGCGFRMSTEIDFQKELEAALDKTENIKIGCDRD